MNNTRQNLSPKTNYSQNLRSFDAMNAIVKFHRPTIRSSCFQFRAIDPKKQKISQIMYLSADHLLSLPAILN